MQTENNVFFTDTYIPWYQTAGALTGYLWCEQNGQIIVGSNENPTATAPLQTGDTQTDVYNWIRQTIIDLTGDAPEAYIYPQAFGMANRWGIESVGAPNSFFDRPFIGLGFTIDYTFGTANAPEYDGKPRRFMFRIEAAGDTEQLSPSYKGMLDYLASEETQPIFQVLELRPE